MFLQIMIFVLVTCFYGAYFYKQIQLKKKGIQANRMAKGSKPSRTKAIEVYLGVATVGTAVFQYISIFFTVYMIPLPTALSVQIVGVILAGCGVIFFILALAAMRDNWRAGVDESQHTSIVISGIYKYSRNPAFVGFGLLYIGTVLAVPNVMMLVVATVTMILFHLQILEEEKYLAGEFGEGYIQYKRETPRYFLFF